MQKPEILRHTLIEQMVLQHPSAVDAAAVELWQRLAAPLVLLVGENGFASLYSRSVYLTQKRFSWLALVTHQAGFSKQASRNEGFNQLAAGLQTQQLEDGNPQQALSGSLALFTTFTDLLAGLIGEALTLGLLQEAWQIHAPIQAEKEI